jgi:hypothetical protein
MERMRRLRMSLASSSPGASGDIARPNYVGPSGNGLVERMKAGESPWNQGRSVKAAPVRFQKAVPRTKEKRRSGAPEGAPVRVMDRQFPPAGGTGPTARRANGVRRSAPAPFGAPLPHVVRETSPRQRGDGNARRSPRLARTGAAELWRLLAGCLKRESENVALENHAALPAAVLT